MTETRPAKYCWNFLKHDAQCKNTNQKPTYDQCRWCKYQFCSICIQDHWVSDLEPIKRCSSCRRRLCKKMIQDYKCKICSILFCNMCTLIPSSTQTQQHKYEPLKRRRICDLCHVNLVCKRINPNIPLDLIKLIRSFIK